MARIVGTHGVRGAVRAVVLSDFPTALRKRRELLLGDELRPVEVTSFRVTGPNAIVQLVGVDSADKAAKLRGELLYIPADKAVRARGQHYWHEVEGLRVETDDGRELGTVSEILRTGANDVYVVNGPLGEVLIPAIAEVVKRVDVRTGRMLVHLLPGLLPGEPD